MRVNTGESLGQPIDVNVSPPPGSVRQRATESGLHGDLKIFIRWDAAVCPLLLTNWIFLMLLFFFNLKNILKVFYLKK